MVRPAVGRVATGRPVTDRASATREIILVTAERLMAEHGVYAVSNRQISEAAGQGNTAAVGYHFGAKSDLVRAIVQRNSEVVEALRAEMVAEIAGSTDLADWVACVVRPTTRHLEGMGSPTWWARFSAQVLTDPALRVLFSDEMSRSVSLRAAGDGVHACRPDLPAEVRAERNDMVRNLVVHMVAERERALADGTPTPRPTWDDAADGLIDAVTGIWLAPAARRRAPGAVASGRSGATTSTS